ncbi:MAG TPA: enoyl-CoA hydratase-related protein [Pyrinomonadaceae bacterium]|nr:enoyl-CoA hydratase-related protein [Pyrinomonadaceae bacterium]
MSATKTVLSESRDGAAFLTLNRPDKRNALNDALIADLKTGLKDAAHDNTVRCIVISGAGADFCSGADLSTLQRISEASVAENLTDAQSLAELFLLMRQLNLPVIAAVRGRALAGGCGLALACDIVLAETTARFGFPEVRIGFVPAMVMAILRRSVSEKIAFELLTTGREVSAAEARSFGLVNHVFEPENFGTEVENFARGFQRLSRSAVSLSKSLFYSSEAMAFEDALAAGVDVNATARMTEDCRQGIARFLKKTAG